MGCCLCLPGDALHSWHRFSSAHSCLLWAPGPSLEAELWLGAAEPVLHPHDASDFLLTVCSSISLQLPDTSSPVPERQELDSLLCHPCSTTAAQAGDRRQGAGEVSLDRGTAAMPRGALLSRDAQQQGCTTAFAPGETGGRGGRGLWGQSQHLPAPLPSTPLTCRPTRLLCSLMREWMSR